MITSSPIHRFCFETLSFLRINLKFTLLSVLVFSLNLFSATPSFAGAGDLDPTFGNGGLVTTDIGGDYGNGCCIGNSILQPDGKILAVLGGLRRFNPDGSLDDTFGDGGVFIVSNPSIANLRWTIRDFALLPDGKILVAGYNHFLTEDGINSNDFFLVRFNADGSLDTTFGTDGKVTNDFSEQYGTETYDYLNFIVVQSDGTIIGVGTSALHNVYPDEQHTIIVRYTPDGLLDTSFGVGGIIEFGYTINSWGYPQKGAQRLLLQPDGKLLIQGYEIIYSNYDNILARYNPDGTLDTTFGTDGVVTQLPNLKSMGLQRDGKILFAGYARDYLSCGFGIHRYNEDGSPDMGFGNGGIVITDFGCSSFGDPYPHMFSEAYHIAVKNDDKIVAFGTFTTYLAPGAEQQTDFALAQYNPDGSLDTTFGNGGKVITEFESKEISTASIFIQPDNKILAFGNLTTLPVHPTYYPHWNPILVRYNTDGVIDTDFGSEGKVIIPVHWTSDDEAKDIVAVQGDGKIIVGGNATRIYDRDFALVRYNHDGSVDSDFGENGRVVTDFSHDHPQSPDGFQWTNDYISAIAVQSDGKIVAMGRSINRNTTYSTLAMARYLPDGTPDETFGVGGTGRVILDIGYEAFFDIALQPDGKIVVVGAVAGRGFTILRFNPGGTLDEQFANGGVFSIDPFNHPEFRYSMVLNAVKIQPDGKIVAAGTFQVHYPFGYSHLDRWTLLRLEADGTPDTSFGRGQDGIVITVLGHYCTANDLALQSDGNIIVAGTANDWIDYPRTLFSKGAQDFTVARYLQDGSLDTTFGIEGLVYTDFDLALQGWSARDEANSVAVQADGRILVAGHVQHDYESPNGDLIDNVDFGLIRLNPNGSLDYGFGNGGKVTTEFGSKEDIGEAVTIQSDGQILVAGSSSQNFRGVGLEIAIARYEGVSTRVDELEGLILRAQELNTDEILNNGQTNSLQVKIQGAIQQIDSGKLAPAINKLEAFMSHVDAFVSAGILSPEQGQVLNDEAQRVIDWLST